jgi:hypothetical protein
MWPLVSYCHDGLIVGESHFEIMTVVVGLIVCCEGHGVGIDMGIKRAWQDGAQRLQKRRMIVTGRIGVTQQHGQIAGYINERQLGNLARLSQPYHTVCGQKNHRDRRFRRRVIMGCAWHTGWWLCRARQ